MILIKGLPISMIQIKGLSIPVIQVGCPHCKPGLFDKQFCRADTAILTSYITFQRNHKEILHTRLMCIYKIHICSFRQDKNFNFVKCLFFSPTSTYALCVSNLKNLNSL
jgi:hypothetical protein